MAEIKIFDAEYRLMGIVWEKEPINSTELVKLCQKELGWKKSTTYSVLKRLAARGILKNEGAIVSSLVKRIEVQKYESEQILEKSFDNSLPTFVAAFLQDKKLSREEAEQIRKMIEEAAK